MNNIESLQARNEETLTQVLDQCGELLAGCFAGEWVTPTMSALERTERLLRAARDSGDRKVTAILQRVLRLQTHRTVLEAEKCTIYIGGFMGVSKHEVRSVKAELGRHAQHQEALHLTFTPKGARKPRGVVYDQPYVLVLAGWGHPDPDGMWVDSGEKLGTVTVQHGRYSACDPRWETDFDARIEGYLTSGSAVVLLDARRTKGAAQ